MNALLRTKMTRISSLAAPCLSNGASSLQKHRFSFEPYHFSAAALAVVNEAVELLCDDDLVAIPTETVYGLAARAFSSEACMKIFQAKGRPADNPLIVHISSYQQLEQVVSCVPPHIRPVMDKFWPGPLTLILPKHPNIPHCVSAGLDTVAVRFPSHPVALEIIRHAGPLAAPSANLSGRPSPTEARHVFADLRDKVSLIVDAGPVQSGMESTVLDAVTDTGKARILRAGGYTYEELQSVLPQLSIYRKGDDTTLEARPCTPGMKYQHYAPKARMLLFERDARRELKDSEIMRYVNNALQEDRNVRIGWMTKCRSVSFNHERIIELFVGDEDNLSEIAHNFFGALRQLDERGVDVILFESVPEIQEGRAIMERARKAASEIISNKL